MFSLLAKEKGTAGVTIATSADLFDCMRLVKTFERCFARSENTRLVGGAAEPFYQPSGDDRPHNLLYFREDYFASALHETAHWCIAGRERRKLADFGYWYAPEGRNKSEQRAFEAVETKPQALEWIFSLACGYRFQVSVDNFSDADEPVNSAGFELAVSAQARDWQAAGLPGRAAKFFDALSEEFGTGARLEDLDFETGTSR